MPPASAIARASTAPEREACLKTEAYAQLKGLTPGVIAADIDFGPFLLALTPHAVLAAPYHRLHPGSSRPMRRSPRRRTKPCLTRLGVTYVITCGPRPPNDLVGSRLGASLWGRLLAKDVPGWLERVSGADRPFHAYRVKSGETG